MNDCWRKFINNRYVFLRLALGGLFIVSGFQKLIGPYQNFLFVVQNYAFLPPWGAELTARVLPWIEFFLGIFLVLGFWLIWILPGIMGLFLAFIIVVGQALIRNLSIADCGCFGALASFPLPVVITFDTILFILVFLLYIRLTQTRCWSLDGYFTRHEHT